MPRGLPDGVRRVVLADRAAADDAAVGVHAEERAAENVAAGVVEVHVDPVRRGVLERRAELRVLVVHGRVEAEFVDQHVALRRRARHADHAALRPLGDLADDVSDRARGRRNHHGVAGARQAEVEQTRNTP